MTQPLNGVTHVTQPTSIINPTEPTPRTIIIQNQADEATIKVNNNLDVIKQVSKSVEAIERVNTNIDNIIKSLDLKDDLKNVASKSNEISALSKISNELGILADNTQLITNLLAEIDSVKAVSKDLPTLLYIFSIRNAIVNINNIKDKVTNLFDKLTIVEKVADKLSTISLIEQHLLAIEIVAQNIDKLTSVTDNINTIKSLIEKYDDVKFIVDNFEKVTKFIQLADQLEPKLNLVKNDIDTKKDEAITELTNKKDEAINEFDTNSLKLQLDMEKLKTANSDFKLQIAEKLVDFERKLLEIEKKYTGATIVHNVTKTVDVDVSKLETTTNNITNNGVNSATPNIIENSESEGNGVEI